MIVQTTLHTANKKTKHQAGKPYATFVITPDENKEVTETIEKDLHFGLVVLGTEKHESRRIDNQLRGRSGRQGDPGVSQFYVALDDEIMRKMGGDTIKSIAKRLLPADELAKLELTQSQFTNSIIRAQKQMEGYNFSIRKHLFEYDNVVNKQRMKVYQKRDELLGRDEHHIDQAKQETKDIINEVINHLWKQHTMSGQSKDELQERIGQIFGVTLNSLGTHEEIQQQLLSIWEEKVGLITSDSAFVKIIRSLYLEQIDKYRIEHIDAMQHLREKVGLYGYAQQDPLVIYKQESFKLYETLWIEIKTDFVSLLYKVDLSHFQGVSTSTSNTINVMTNEEAFDDALTGDMSVIPGFIAPEVLPGRDAKLHEDENLQVIDLSQLKKKPLSESFSGSKKVGANESCPCGSGKKYKKCHGAL